MAGNSNTKPEVEILKMEIRKMSIDHIEEIKSVIKETFSAEPWNDDWHDEQQFHAYILDLIDNKNSLSLGLYDNDHLIGVSLGRIKHWYTGTEYWIDDLAILPKAQGKGCGSAFVDLIEEYAKETGIAGIVLFTEKNIPAYGLYIKKDFEERPERVFFEKKILWE